MIKRLFDILVSGAGLIVFAPLAAVIAAAIKLEDGGPVLFVQERVGKDCRVFQALKFRSMIVDAERHTGAVQATVNDPRVTRVGRLLRRSSLDELPQLMNVVRGDMSLVGPRPLVPEEDRKVQGWARRRLHLTPGMTGNWQTLGAERVPLHEMVKIDYLYIANWSLWGDIKALLRTAPHVFGRRGL